jgi:hypothetical protein
LRWEREYVEDSDEVLDRLEKSLTEERVDAEKALDGALNTDRGWREWNNLVNEWGLRALTDEAVVELARRYGAYLNR